MKSITKTLTAICISGILSLSSLAIAQNEAPKKTLFTNVNVFDGFASELAMDMNVLVEDNHIVQVSAEPISADAVIVIDGNGRTLTPGLICIPMSLSKPLQGRKVSTNMISVLPVQWLPRLCEIIC